jgi:hypothetical protein
MLDYLTLNDHDGNAVAFHDRPALALTSVEGLPGLGFSAPRDSTYAAPSRNGNVTRSRWLSAGLVTVEGYARGATANDARAALDVLKKPLYDALAAPRTLLWQFSPGGLELQADARLAGAFSVRAENTRGNFLRWQANLRLDDGRGYSQVQSIIAGDALSASAGGKIHPFAYPYVFNAADGGGALVENLGTVPTSPTFRIFGACTAPTLRLLTTGEEIVLTGDIAATEHVEVDVAQHTVKRNGVVPAQGIVSSAATRWFEIPTGQHIVQLLSNTFDTIAHVDVYLRSAYL